MHMLEVKGKEQACVLATSLDEYQVSMCSNRCRYALRHHLRDSGLSNGKASFTAF